MKDLIEDLMKNCQFQEGVGWKRYRVLAGNVIIHKGEIGETLFFLETGQIRVLGSAELSETQRVSPGLCDLNAGSVFGDACLYEPLQRMATVVALTDVELIEFNGGMLSDYLDKHPVEGYRFLKALYKDMIKRLAVANQRVGNLLAWGIRVHDINKYL
jgi:CRP-like cAMP-binding protein